MGQDKIILEQNAWPESKRVNGYGRVQKVQAAEIRLNSGFVLEWSTGWRDSERLIWRDRTAVEDVPDEVPSVIYAWSSIMWDICENRL